MRDSTACLVRLNAPHIKLAFQLLSAGQGDMQEDNPVSCHLEPEVSLVAARLDFPGMVKDGRHARVCHVRLHRNLSSRDRVASRIDQSETHDRRSGPDRRGRDFMLNRDRARRIRRPGAGGREQSCSAGAQQESPTFSGERANQPPAPLRGERDLASPRTLAFSDQAACIEGLWSHAQEQTIVLSSASDGNMW